MITPEQREEIALALETAEWAAQVLRTCPLRHEDVARVCKKDLVERLEGLES